MSQKFEKHDLKKKSDNLSDWYTDVILKAELADYGPAKGTMVIRPYGYALWERVQDVFNKWIKEYGVDNAYFPMFIPMSLFKKEASHVEGFSPELAVVTHGGGKELSEPLAVRPTSETIMYEMYSKWINSWRDLPLKINQWNNAVRWEMRTYLFLRTTEFLWQEGHTAHATENEAVEMQEQALEWYKKLHEEYYAVPVIAGCKSNNEKFAGAKTTYTIEALMPDGKALQAGTSHNLGQNFSKAFNIQFQNNEGKSEYAWQTSWGLSTRSLGGLFLVHGDDDGLILPPRIAPIQVVILPILKDDNEKLMAYARQIHDELEKKGIRVKMDDRDAVSFGRKVNDWEVKGVPLRLEIGGKEAEENSITVFRRDTKDKQTQSKEDFINEIESIIEDIQSSLFNKAKTYLEENTHEVSTYDEFKEVMNNSRGFIKVFWEENSEIEEKIKQETKATSRVKVPNSDEEGIDFYTGKKTNQVWYFAQSY